METGQVFEARKADHISAALDPIVQSERGSDFDRYELVHEALPEINFSDISIATRLFENHAGEILVESPFFISSMTAGHRDSVKLNELLAGAACSRGWAMGVGSQRRELADSQSSAEWSAVRKQVPNAVLFGNIGLSQVIEFGTDKILQLVDSLEAAALIVHLNPLQEALQLEGTPEFRGGLAAIHDLAQALDIRFKKPLIIKETGCGISASTAEKLLSAGVTVIDVAGRGGTHWGRIEGWRSHRWLAEDGKDKHRAEVLYQASQSFREWGITTVDALEQVVQVARTMGITSHSQEVWASGGVRTGLDGAKAIKLGAKAVGIAQPLLAAALESERRLELVMECFEYELKMALFCTGCRDLAAFTKSARILTRDMSAKR